MRPRPLLALALAAIASPALAQFAAPSVLIGVDTDTPNFQDFQVFDVSANAFGPSIPSSNIRPMGIAYDQAIQRVYIMTRGNPTQLWQMDVNPLTSPTQIGTFNNGGGGGVVNAAGGGLAWDGANGRLIITAFGTIYASSGVSGTNLPLRVLIPSGGSLKGADIDPITRALYVVNTGTSSSGPVGGGGVYRIDPPYETGRVVKLAALPLRAGVPDTEVEAVTVGAGHIWLSGERTDSLYRIRMSDLAYEAPVAMPVTATGTSAGSSFIGSDDAGPEVGVDVRNYSDTAVPNPGEATFVVTLRNVGSATATAVTASVPVPAGTTFVSATNSAVLNGSTVELSAGDLAPGQGAGFNVTFASASTFVATASVATTAADVFAGNNSASASSLVGAPDLVVAITPPANCSVPAGGQATFAITVTNRGSQAVASTLTMPIPAGATYFSSTPPGVPGGGFVGIDIGVIPAGDSVVASVAFTPGESLLFGITATASALGDTSPADNTASASATVANFSAAPIRALLSTTAPSAAVPGMVGTLVAGRTIDSVRSANGQWLITRWQASVNNQDDVLLLTSLPGGASTVIAQEGTTVLPNGQMPIADSFTGACVNNAGNYAFSGRAASALDYQVKNIAGMSSMVSFEGDPAPTITGGTTFNGASSIQISNSDVISYISSFNGLTAATDEFALTANDSIVIYQDGTTVPGTGGPQTDIQNVGFYTSADGTRYLYEGRSNIGGTKTTAVVGTTGGTDQTTLIIQGNTLPGLSSPTAAIPLDGGTVMTPEGRWFVRGSNADGDDWVISGTGNTVSASNVILHTGATGTPVTPIIPGSTEFWSPGGTSVMGIWANTGNPRGDTLIVGETTGPSASNFVFVLNGTTILAREGDPVDANNNGAFDDDVYIRGLQARDTVVLTDEAMYAVVTLRDRTGVCADAATTFATALIRVPIPQPTNSVCCRGATCAVIPPANCTDPAGLAGAFSPGGTTCNAGGSASTPCCYADYNKTGGIAVQDIFDFLNDWFAASPYARTGSDGSPAPLAVQNIFDFLNAWFGGC